MPMSPEPWSESGATAIGWFGVVDGDGVVLAIVRKKEHARAIAALPKLIAACRKVRGACHTGTLWDSQVRMEEILAELDAEPTT